MKLQRPLVYISGKYRSKWGIIGRIINILRAYRAARRLTKQGYVCIVPHLETALMDGLQPDEWFLEASLKKLRHCDMIYMLKGWRTSAGACQELQEAYKRGMKIWYEDIDDALEVAKCDLKEFSVSGKGIIGIGFTDEVEDD